MTDTIISVDSLGKSYRIGRLRQKPQTIREAMSRLAGSPFAYLAERLRNPAESEILWALRNVSFEVKQGEVLGVIGRNGAGKSTLLKILSRITDPTEGHACIRGRVNSLLEVGTGFHPELTGRENIYMNAAIHGMCRENVARKLDEIVAFAELERFIDTPVKRYSSGMYMRLAFAVAAHLDPDVLIIDEVLAVGDAAFQKKCLGRMGEVVLEGRTILFVSHNIPALIALCPKSILLKAGQFVAMGTTSDVLATYISGNAGNSQIELRGRTDRRGDGRARITDMSVTDGSGAGTIRCGSKLKISVTYESRLALRAPRVMISLRDQFNQAVYFLDSEIAGGLPEQLVAQGVITCKTGPLNITPGPLYLNVALYAFEALLDHVTEAMQIDIVPDDFFGTGRMLDRSASVGLLSQEWGCF